MTEKPNFLFVQADQLAARALAASMATRSPRRPTSTLWRPAVSSSRTRSATIPCARRRAIP